MVGSRKTGGVVRKRPIGVLQALRHGENAADALTPVGLASAAWRGRETADFLRSNSVLAADVATRGLECIPYHGPQTRQRVTNFRVISGLRSRLRESGTASVSWRASTIHPSLAEVAKTPKGEVVYATKGARFLKKSAARFALGKTQPHYSEDPRSFSHRTTVLRRYVNGLLKDWNASTPSARKAFLRSPIPFVSVVSSSLYPSNGPVERMVLKLIGKGKLGRAFKPLEGVRIVFYSDGSKDVYVLRRGPNGSFCSPRLLR